MIADLELWSILRARQISSWKLVSQMIHTRRKEKASVMFRLEKTSIRKEFLCTNSRSLANSSIQELQVMRMKIRGPRLLKTCQWWCHCHWKGRRKGRKTNLWTWVLNTHPPSCLLLPKTSSVQLKSISLNDIFSSKLHTANPNETSPSKTCKSISRTRILEIRWTQSRIISTLWIETWLSINCLGNLMVRTRKVTSWKSRPFSRQQG